MQKKIIYLISMILFSNLSCQNKDKKNDKVEVDKHKTNLVNVNLNKDLDNILVSTKFDTSESEFSEYLYAYNSKDVELFKLGKIEFTSKHNIEGIQVPNDSYISFCTSNEESKKIEVIHLKYNLIEADGLFFDQLKKEFGEPRLLSTEDSINKFKGNQNYIWDNFNKSQSLIISQFKEGNAIITGDTPSKQVTSVLIYIVDNNAIINYPNNQKENILERLNNRFSE
jgi:hypothetical protein